MKSKNREIDKNTNGNRIKIKITSDLESYSGD